MYWSMEEYDSGVGSIDSPGEPASPMDKPTAARDFKNSDTQCVKPSTTCGGGNMDVTVDLCNKGGSILVSEGSGGVRLNSAELTLEEGIQALTSCGLCVSETGRPAVSMSSRVSDASSRVSAESSRVSAASSHVSATSGRVSATSHVSAASDRVSAAFSRVSAASSCVSAASSRVSAASSRVSAASSHSISRTNNDSTHYQISRNHSSSLSSRHNPTLGQSRVARGELPHADTEDLVVLRVEPYLVNQLQLLTLS